MNLAQPWALALAVLAVPVVISYLHRRRRTPLVVPSAMLLRVIAGQTTPKSRAMAKPRHLVSLLLVLLALAGLVAALVDLQRDDEQPRNYIVVLDTSGSMEGEKLEQAKEALVYFLENLPRAVPVANLVIGLAKGVVFGFVIAVVACHFGLHVKPNTESLSVNTTSSVVTAITTVILIDAIFAIFTRSIGVPQL